MARVMRQIVRAASVHAWGRARACKIEHPINELVRVGAITRLCTIEHAWGRSRACAPLSTRGGDHANELVRDHANELVRVGAIKLAK